MRTNQDDDDFVNELERLDAFLDGGEGDVPLAVLRERGVEVPDESTLDDEALHTRLWEVLHALAGIGMYLEDTDHLSDRELYHYLRTSALVEETCLPLNGKGMVVCSPIGGCSEEDLRIYCRYYANEDDRKSFADDGVSMPPHEDPPYDRDRLLPVWEPLGSVPM